jgi:mono/diheme cytochrome c family protein
MMTVLILGLVARNVSGAAGAASPPPVEAADIPGGDWQMYNKTFDAQRYSPLKQIRNSNAAALVETCRVRIADTTHEPEIARGRQLLYGMCSGCHGSDGKNISIDGHDLTTVGRRMSVEQLISWIKNPKAPMPKVFPEPLQASEEMDVRDVAAFLHEWPQ